MIDNIDHRVGDLSRAEVHARQRGNTRYVDDILKLVNSDIAEVEDFILVAKLIG